MPDTFTALRQRIADDYQNLPADQQEIEKLRAALKGLLDVLDHVLPYISTPVPGGADINRRIRRARQLVTR